MGSLLLVCPGARLWVQPSPVSPVPGLGLSKEADAPISITRGRPFAGTWETPKVEKLRSNPFDREGLVCSCLLKGSREKFFVKKNKKSPRTSQTT